MNTTTMTEGQKVFDFIKAKLENKMIIVVSTYLRAVQYDKRHLKDLNTYFKVLNGELYERRGKSWDCIATKNHCLVSVEAHPTGA